MMRKYGGEGNSPDRGQISGGEKRSRTIRILAGAMLACGLMAVAAGGSFLMSGTAGSRPVKTPEDYIKDARAYLEDGDYYEAIVSCEKLLEDDTYGREAWSGLANGYSRLGNYEEEERVREQIALDDPGDLDNQIRLIEIMIRNKELEAAKDRTEELLGQTDSEELRSLYEEMNIDPPEYNLTSGTYDDYQLLKLTGTYENAMVHYTVDGNEPTEKSPVLQDGIVISFPQTTVRAAAIGALGYKSEETVLEMTVTRPVEDLSNDYSLIMQYIRNNILNKAWNEPVYNYEMAQVTDVYIIGSYIIEAGQPEAVFYEDCYKQYDNQEYNRGQFDLGFVQYTPFLKRLSMSYQNNLDVTPLAGLSYLEELSLLNDNIGDVSALAGLTSLRKLALGWNNISDVSPLAGLVNLESLGLWNNQVSDVNMLGGLTQLTYFDVSNNQVSQIECTRNMPGLSEVWINNNQIGSLSPLDRCDRLMVVMQSGNPVSDYGTLREKAAGLYKSDLEQ